MPRVEALEALQVTNLLIHPLALPLDLGLRQQAPPASWKAALPSPQDTSAAAKLAAVAGLGYAASAGSSPGVSLAPASVAKDAGDAWSSAFQTAGDLPADPLGGEPNPGSASAFSPGGNGAASRTAAGENETAEATPEFGDRSPAPPTAAPGAANHDSSSPQDLLADLALTWTPSSGAGAADGSGVVSAAGGAAAPAAPRGGLVFEPNVGQAAAPVRFLSRGRGYGLFLTSTEAVLTLNRPTSTARTANVLRMQIVGGNPAAPATGVNPLTSRSNYFYGRDRSRWRTNVANFGRVQFANVYAGIDLVYYGTSQRQLEYDFVVRPGADPRTIQLGFQGTTGLRLDPRGSLVISTTGGDVVQPAPVLYQLVGTTRQAVTGGYALPGGGRVAFQVGAYNPTLPLYIDPVVSYSTYLGGSAEDEGNAIAVDSDGSVYVTGKTTSADFPTDPNPLQADLRGPADVFVTKLSPAGDQVIYSTYLGGLGTDVGTGIAVDGFGFAYLTGYTTSADFPTTLGVYQPDRQGITSNAFVAKLDPLGASLAYSTYLGSGDDVANAIAIDAAGNAYVTGSTQSPFFPLAQPLTQGMTPLGGKEVFVSELNPTGTGLLFSTYLSGSGDEEGKGIAVGSDGRIYVGGWTTSGNLPSPRAWRPTNGGGQDGFVASLFPTSTGLTFLTYLGGLGTDAVNAIAVDAGGNAYVTGVTNSDDFPTTYALQPEPASSGGSDDDVFVAELSSPGYAAVYSTYLSGIDNEQGTGIAVDADGNAYVTGWTSSFDFPVTEDALQPFLRAAGATNGFVTQVSAIGATLAHSTFYGGSIHDELLGIAVDSSGYTYVTGWSSSPDFPVEGGGQPSGVGLRNFVAAAIWFEGYRLINVIPNNLSNEKNQDSEPSLAVAPTANPDTRKAAITTFSRVNGELRTLPLRAWGADGVAPVWASTNSGLTWSVEGHIPGPGARINGPVDQTLAYNTDGSRVYGVFLGDNKTFYVGSTANPATTGFGGNYSLSSTDTPDQPWIQAARVNNQDRVYVAFNDRGNLPNSASVIVSTDGGATFQAPVRIDRGTPAGGDGIARVAVQDNKVYAAFFRWTGPGGALTVPGQVVVVRDDRGGITNQDNPNPFRALTSGGGAVGVTVASGALIQTNFFLGQQRLGADLSIAIDPSDRDGKTVYVAYTMLTENRLELYAKRSTDGGSTWEDVYGPLTNAALPALAVAANGTWGMLYTELRGNNMEMKFIQGVPNRFTAVPATLAVWPAFGRPARQFHPYIGDYHQLVAVGTTFYGTFSASNEPDSTHFPKGVRFQRSFKDAAGTNHNNGDVLPSGMGELIGPEPTRPPLERISIDPYFFRVQAIAPRR